MQVPTAHADQPSMPQLDDRYTQTTGCVLLSGNQALVRLPIQQRLLDQAAGLNTGGFISGYRGSPLGRYDMELWGAARHLEALNVKFQPGVNEDLAGTAVWGSQNVGLVPGAQVDGVFGLWYGKGPGVDRSMDVLKHANLAGSNAKGGVLVLAGDDHGAKSSTTAHQSEPVLMAAGIPVLAPSNVQDILDMGLHGIAMSRFSGCWVALKLVTDVVESTATVDVALDRLQPVLPPVPAIPGGVSIRITDMPLAQEVRLYQAKLPLAVAYARANGLNRVVLDVPNARLGIVAAGKAFADTLQALQELGLDEAACQQAGIRLLKVGLVFPLDPEAVTRFAEGLDTVLVIEEKRGLIESQMKTALVDAGVSIPKFIGKSALPATGELAPNIVAHAIAKAMGQAERAEKIPLPIPIQFGPDGRPILGPMRLPGFCSGCPHNTSTKLPDGSRALAGIGCHAMALLSSPHNTMTVSHMGGEGVMWTGQAPFTAEKHVFANMGDGTYFHSGLLAIRQAVASKTNITYKLLYNGFVSMTGGQPVDGEMTLPQTVRQLQSEGVKHIVVTTEDVDRVRALGLPPEVPVHDRGQLDRLQRELREMAGTTVLIHDQSCATERRRLRKRGKLPDPAVRTFIHPEVCEGCGDCGVQSNCLSIEPLETSLGRKRKINQSSCNKDFSCVKGFCPSIVTVHGAQPKKAQGARKPAATVDENALALPDTTLRGETHGVLITGIGGTGVVTLGAVVAMAAHLDGLAVSTLDVTGLAQKYGAVMTHLRIARDPRKLASTRLAMGEADVVVGCDLLVSAGDEALSRLRPGQARLVVNSAEVPTSDFSRNPDWAMDSAALMGRLQAAAGERLESLDATALATTLLGDAVFANMLLLGVAWQRGLVPVSWPSLKTAVKLNGVQEQRNLLALNWGRLWALDATRIRQLAADARPAQVIALPVSERLPALVSDRVARLTAYQNATLGRTYQQRIEGLARAATQAGVGDTLVKQAARQYYRLLAHKDEYEVGRLYSDPAFKQLLAQEFDGELTVHYHLGGGPLAKTHARTGAPLKTEKVFGMTLLMALLGKLRVIRGSWIDPFRLGHERQLANRLRALYEADLDRMTRELQSHNANAMKALADWPALVRGFGHVRAANADKALTARDAALALPTQAAAA